MLRLWPRAQTCGEARHAVRGFCLVNDLEHLVDDAELLTSEVVSNAIESARALVTLWAVCRRGVLIVSVRDDDTNGVPVVGVLDDALADGGRGMFLVQQLAEVWGITDHHDGKSIWFRLR